MQFNSLTFIGFLLFVYLAYRIVPHRLQNFVLLIASYTFYAWWDVRFLFLIVLSTVLNYSCGLIFRTGEIRFATRFIFSTSILCAFFLTVLFPWNHLAEFQGLFTGKMDWGALTSGMEEWRLFLALGIIIFASNLLYPKIAVLDLKRKRSLFLFLGVSGNLFILGFFKYYNFFIENVEWVLSRLSISSATLHLDIILPIGISFYIFKGISYLIDTYHGRVDQDHGCTDFALYMAFFPSLLAGPIDRGSAFLKQVCNKRSLSWDQSIRGLHLFIYGLFKKVVIADGVVRTVSSVFDSTGQASWIDVVVATVLFTIQIYCDFSGYTDMARGTAKLFGIDLMINFNLPYFSKNPREFWSRWHISLSTWLRDYLYIPLGGNRGGTFQTGRNLMITMLLGGLWHGAAWGFVFWGFYHGLILTIHRAIASYRSATRVQDGILGNMAKFTGFFLIICYGWLLFRAPSLEKIASLTSVLIFDFGNLDFGAAWPRLAALVGLPVFLMIEMIEGVGGGKPFYAKVPVPVWTGLYAMIIFCMGIGLTTESTQFIYMVF